MAAAKKLSVGRGMNRRMTKAGEAAMKHFNDLVVAHLKSLDAQPDTFYQWTIQTKVGILRVSSNGNWIAQRFDDVNAAREFFGVREPYNREHLNVYSGKWNFHYDLGAAEREVDDWKRQLQRVLNDPREDAS